MFYMWFSTDLIVKHRAEPKLTVVCCWMQTEWLSLQWLITLPHVHLLYTNLMRLIFFTSGSLLVILLKPHLKMSDLELFGREETMQECTWLTTTEKKKSLIVNIFYNDFLFTIVEAKITSESKLVLPQHYNTSHTWLLEQAVIIYLYVLGQISSPPPEIRYQAPRAKEESVDCKRNWPESVKLGSSVSGFQDYVKYRQIIY